MWDQRKLGQLEDLEAEILEGMTEEQRRAELDELIRKFEAELEEEESVKHHQQYQIGTGSVPCVRVWLRQRVGSGRIGSGRVGLGRVG